MQNDPIQAESVEIARSIGRCPVCDFDVSRNASVHCPECGCHVVTEHNIRSYPKSLGLTLASLGVGVALWGLGSLLLAAVTERYTGTPFSADPVSLTVHAATIVVVAATLLVILYRRSLRHATRATFNLVQTLAIGQALIVAILWFIAL